tara:strand:- start:8286 stop:8564 length:279 start_codon:yes stop_codon:yes gene_type:complete
MNILILGGNGYLGWPMSMNLSKQGHHVYIVDNLSKSQIMNNCNIKPLNAKFKKLGLNIIKFDEKLIENFITKINNYKDNSDKDQILPNIYWK